MSAAAGGLSGSPRAPGRHVARADPRRARSRAHGSPWPMRSSRPPRARGRWDRSRSRSRRSRRWSGFARARPHDDLHRPRRARTSCAFLGGGLLGGAPGRSRGAPRRLLARRAALSGRGRRLPRVTSPRTPPTTTWWSDRSCNGASRCSRCRGLRRALAPARGPLRRAPPSRRRCSSRTAGLFALGLSRLDALTAHVGPRLARATARGWSCSWACSGQTLIAVPAAFLLGTPITAIVGGILGRWRWSWRRSLICCAGAAVPAGVPGPAGDVSPEPDPDATGHHRTRARRGLLGSPAPPARRQESTRERPGFWSRSSS